MNMRILASFLVLASAVLVAGTAQAQIKCWTGADGKRVCGDIPPTGSKTVTIKAPSGPAAPAAASKDAKDAKGDKGAKKSGPMTPAEQEQDFRKRQADAQKAAAKAEQEKQDAAAKKENCAQARESLQTMEAGQRVARTNAQGERYFLDEAQVQGELVKARKAVQDWCS
jgi:Domain of unknown function (DUF4124)